jgi:hypothetical protein
MLESILFERSEFSSQINNIFTQAKIDNVIKLYTGKINPLLIAKGFDEENDNPKTISDLLEDGAFLGKVLEKTVLNRLKKMNLDVESLGRNAPYDLKYRIIDDVSKEIKEGNIEIRVFGKNGVYLGPSSTKGAKRLGDFEKTQKKIEGADFYILINIRNITNSLTYDVYLVVSTYLADMLKNNKIGKYGRIESYEYALLLLNKKANPKTIEEFEDTISYLKDRLNDPEVNKNSIKNLIKKYEKELQYLKNNQIQQNEKGIGNFKDNTSIFPYEPQIVAEYPYYYKNFNFIDFINI